MNAPDTNPRPETTIRSDVGAGAADRPTRENLDLVEYVNAKWRRLARSVDLAGRFAEVLRAG